MDKILIKKNEKLLDKQLEEMMKPIPQERKFLSRLVGNDKEIKKQSSKSLTLREGKGGIVTRDRDE